MNLIHTFSEDEKRIVGVAYQKYLQIIEVIRDLHQLDGPLTVDPMVGFFQPSPKGD